MSDPSVQVITGALEVPPMTAVPPTVPTVVDHPDFDGVTDDKTNWKAVPEAISALAVISNRNTRPLFGFYILAVPVPPDAAAAGAAIASAMTGTARRHRR